MAEASRDGNAHFSHFGPEANLFEELEALFRGYGETGHGKLRRYLHDEEEAAPHGQPPGTFTPWGSPGRHRPPLLRGLHGGVVTERVDVARYPDLLVGVVPIVNLEWIQKMHRDKAARGYSTEAVVDTILRRMPDYVNYICPQFSRTHVNFQRVPTVDTSNPFIARDIPTADESLVVIRFRDPKGIDFPYLLTMLHDSFMSRQNTIVVPGGKMELAMQLIFTPMILRLMDRGGRRDRPGRANGAPHGETETSRPRARRRAALATALRCSPWTRCRRRNPATPACRWAWPTSRRCSGPASCHSPSNPIWPDRDRFVVSNGHGSMLLYALLHLTGYDLPMEELKRFRQLGSRTPGHPERGVTPGVETTTGPLGQGLANAVGMALAERIWPAEFNRPGFESSITAPTSSSATAA